MASNMTTQGQEAVVCDLCQSPVSFFCRRCGVNLCDPCVLLHLRVKSKFGHDVVDYASKDDDECSVFCKTCDLCEHKLHDLSELSVKVEEVLKNITPETGLLQSFRHELEALLDPAQIQKFRKREVEEKEGGLTRMFLFFSILFCCTTFFVIHENSKLDEIYFQSIKNMLETAAQCKIDENVIQNHFENNRKVLQTKFSMLERRFVPDPDSSRKMLELPSVSSVIYTGFVDTTLYDMAVTDDQKVWMGGNSKELKLFDLQGHLHRTVTTTWYAHHICMYNKQLLYSDWLHNSVKKISDDDTELTMFTTGDWAPYGITESAFGDLLVCLRKDDQSKVVRYSSNGTVLQEIQYISQSQPLYQAAWYIAENVNWDIIVTDDKKHNVIAVNTLGIFRYMYPGRNNDIYAVSVATDSVGHVYVTDTIYGRIHMLDIDGQFMRYIIPEGGIMLPRAVCMIGDGEMIVGERLSGLAKRINLFEYKKDINE